MIFVPSPQAILHKNHPNYEQSDLFFNKLNENHNLTKQEYLSRRTTLTDNALLSSSNSQHPFLLTYFDALIEIGFSLKYELKFHNSLHHLFYGILAMKCNDIKTAIYFLKIAAENENIYALNLLANIYFLYFETDLSSLTISKNYLANAYLKFSIDSLYQLANFYIHFNKPILSLHFYYFHFRATGSNTTILKMCNILKYFLCEEHLTRKLMLYSISRGEPKYIESIVLTMCSNDKIIKLWKNILTDFNQRLSLSYQANISISKLRKRQRNETYINNNFRNLLKSNYNLNSELNSELIVKPICNKIDDMRGNPIQFHSSIELNHNCYSQNSLSNSYINNISKKTNFTSFYPSKNKTKLILDIFELASSDFNKRNLKLAEFFISKLYSHDSKGILGSEIFKLRCSSSNHKWLSSCGFIYLLLNDINSGYNMFLKASKLGSFCATMMCGFILFHWKHCQEQMKKNACYFFLKCSTDPIALIHLSFILEDLSLLDRACGILGIKSRIKTIVWLVDLLIEGIKMPSLSIYPAKIICISGIEFGLQNEEDATDIFECYLRHFQ